MSVNPKSVAREADLFYVVVRDEGTPLQRAVWRVPARRPDLLELRRSQTVAKYQGSTVTVTGPHADAK